MTDLPIPISLRSYLAYEQAVRRYPTSPALFSLMTRDLRIATYVHYVIGRLI